MTSCSARPEVWSRLRNVDAMGGGDIKMLAMVGAFLGVQGTAVTFVIASYLGGLTGIALIVSRRGGMMSKVPFGTFLAGGAAVAAVAGDAIL